jgi:hypothetical protein
MVRNLERSKHRAALCEGTLDRVTRNGRSNALAVVHSRAANRSRVPHIAKPVRTSSVARALL